MAYAICYLAVATLTSAKADVLVQLVARMMGDTTTDRSHKAKASLQYTSTWTTDSLGVEFGLP